jgi:hypothetical protein
MGDRLASGWKRRRFAFVLAALLLAVFSPASASTAEARSSRSCAPATAAHVDALVKDGHSTLSLAGPQLRGGGSTEVRAPRVSRGAGTVTIPMYFHIVTNGAGANGNVPNRRIQGPRSP